jgi:chemotaxis protein methyltransferase WspC
MRLATTKVKRWLAEHAGLDPELLDRAWLDRVIQRRLEERGVADADSYCRVLDQDPRERERIVEQVSVGETSFFRYPNSFEVLVRHLSGLRGRPPQRSQLRMLSVACATGEEPYSMAMAAVHAGWPHRQVTVDAIDRNAEALAAARAGVYSLRVPRQPLPTWARHWMHEEARRLHVDAAIRKTVRFHCGDVLTAPSGLLPGRYAVVFCRNLLIYLHDEARNELVAKLAAWLEPEGLLFVGHAEQVERLQPRFAILAEPGAFALRYVRATDPGLSDEPAASTLAPVSPAEQAEGLAARTRFPRAWPPTPRSRVSQASSAGVAGTAGAKRSAAPAEASQTPPPTKANPLGSPDEWAIERVRALADTGRLIEAAEAAEAALTDGSASAELYQLLGSVQLARGRFAEARDALRRAVYLDSRHEESLLQLAMVYQRMGEESQAARYRKRAARVHRQKEGESTS